MDIKQNNATYNRPEGDRVIDAPLVRMNLAESIQQIKSESAWLNGDRNALTLLHSGELRIVLIALHQHAEMSPHTVDGGSFIQVLEGRIWIETLEQSLSLDVGEGLAFAPGMPRSYFAEKEATLLLSISGISDDFIKDLPGF